MSRESRFDESGDVHILDEMFDRLRVSVYLSLPTWEARSGFRCDESEVAQRTADFPELELLQLRSKQGRAFQVVRASLTPEGLAPLSPVSLGQLQRTYARTADGKARLNEVLAHAGE